MGLTLLFSLPGAIIVPILIFPKETKNMKEFYEAWLKPLFENVLIQRILAAVILCVIGILAIRVVNKVLKRALQRSTLEKAAHTLILSLTSAAMYLLLGLMVASSLGIDVTGIVALASVLTLALSLALQNMVSNIIGGFTILYAKPFHSGDYVEIGDQAGTVTEINMSYTMLTTPDNKLVSIPNSTVVAARVTNYSSAETRRVEVTVSASYDTPTQKVIDALALAGTMDNVLLDPAPQAVITGYGESAINYSLRVWVKNADYWTVYFALTQRIKDIFDDQGVTMTYPHLNVHLDK